jgi:hypothetical protein
MSLRSRIGFRPGDTQMLDVMMLVIGLGFFVLSLAYLYACDQL